MYSSQHLINCSQQLSFEGRLTKIHEADDDAVNWMKTMAMTRVVSCKISAISGKKLHQNFFSNILQEKRT